jgi:SAM-dependent methyltransferase
LLEPSPGDAILDLGCGQGVLAPHIARAGAHYMGVDASPRMLDLGRRRHGSCGKFVLGDARHLPDIKELSPASFDSVAFLLSLQDMDPLEEAIAGAAWALKPRGRVVLLLTHPAFRVPRQSGWGWDEGRKLMFRRVDRYLTSLPVPMKALPGKDVRATTRSFHRPIQAYVNGLAEHELLTEHLDELPAHKLESTEPGGRAETIARREIPLFLAIRARKLAT